MIFAQKTKTVGRIKDFLHVSPEKKRILTGTALTGLGIGAVATLFHPTQAAVPAMAMPTPMFLGLNITERIMHAFDPLIQLIQGLAYPVTFIMFSAGFLVMISGKPQRGLQMMKWAALGYLGMMFLPAIMTILVEVGKSMMIGK